jgi:hypothetical protein
MRIDYIHTKYKGKTYTSILLRHAYRKDGKVRHKTLLNLTHYPPEEIKAIELALKHKNDLNLLNSLSGYTYSNLYSIGSVYLLYQISKRLGIVNSLGKSEKAKLILWQVIARMLHPGSKLGSVRIAKEYAALEVLNMSNFCEDDIYSSLSWAVDNQGKIEERLMRYRGGTKNLYLYDVSSSYFEGDKNELAEYGYSRDKRRGKKQIVIGLLTDKEGYPVSVQVYKGNTHDVNTFAEQIEKVKNRTGIEHVIFVGDKGMIKSRQQELLNARGYHYITSITKPQIEKLLSQGVIQMSLFDEDLMEIVTDTGVRYILRRNSIRAKELQNSREERRKSLKAFIEKQN